jgi:hypothetical protein
MPEHAVQLDYDQKNRYTNDTPFHEDNETMMMELLQDNWKIAHTQNIKPMFYVTDKDITHDLAVAPAIVVYEVTDDNIGIGIGYTAQKSKLSVNIDVFTLDRTQLIDTKDEVLRILRFCRKRPIPGWDFIYTMTARRLDPRAGNYRYVIVAGLERLVRILPEVKWGDEDSSQ